MVIMGWNAGIQLGKTNFKEGRSFMMYKILNLYAGLGGNRLQWQNCEVTAIEIDKEMCRMYKERFPNDIVINTDAHQFLLENFKDYDFIWSSPPCPTHSLTRFFSFGRKKPVFPDMKLYEEIIFLRHHAKENQKWIVENVNPYYEVLIPAQKLGRHLFWSNFQLPKIEKKDISGNLIVESRINDIKKHHCIDKFDYKGTQNRLKILRNCVSYDIGLAILNKARGIQEIENQKNLTLF